MAVAAAVRSFLCVLCARLLFLGSRHRPVVVIALVADLGPSRSVPLHPQVVAPGRFELDLEHLFLFSSTDATMMPGNILLRTVRVEQSVSTDASVLAGRARDKVRVWVCLFVVPLAWCCPLVRSV